MSTTPFAWGISTSSYQFEDPATEPGSGQDFTTDWDRCLIAHGHAPPRGNALSSWTHFDRDLEMFSSIGVTHHRFGIEWARIEPTPGRYNELAIERYVEMARQLRKAGIEPVVCLWHFTFPGWLYDDEHPRRSNWLHSVARERWQAFLHKVVPPLAEEVEIFAPQNEPNGQLSTAYLAGLWPPARRLDFPAYHEALEQCVAHFEDAVQIVRSVRASARILSIHALPWWTHGKFDIADAIFDETVRSSFEHLDRVAPHCDLIGINYYFSQPASIVGFATLSTHRGPHFTEMGWLIDPEGLFRQIRFVGKRYGKPMWITENGIATESDPQRIHYMIEHLTAVRRAIDDGFDVRGYFVWSLADNYEWHWGYTARFGLCAFDPTRLSLEPKPSAAFYREVIARSPETIVIPSAENLGQVEGPFCQIRS